MSDFLEDAREERFCEYVVVHGSLLSAAWQKAFRLDCGLSEADRWEAERESDRLSKLDYVKVRMRQIRERTANAGKLTKELLAAEIEEKLMGVLSDRGYDSKDRLNLAKTAVVLSETLKKLRGWDKDEASNGVTLTLNRVFPAGFKGVKKEKTTVRVDFGSDEQSEGVLCEREASGTKRRVSKLTKGD